MHQRTEGLAKIHIDDLFREAERNRHAREVTAGRPGAIDAVGFRSRIARLLGGFPPLHSGGPRPVGA